MAIKNRSYGVCASLDSSNKKFLDPSPMKYIIVGKFISGIFLVSFSFFSSFLLSGSSLYSLLLLLLLFIYLFSFA